MPEAPRNRPRRPGARWKLFRQRLANIFLGGRILCDRCRYDYGDACRRPERPNATLCEDYETR